MDSSQIYLPKLTLINKVIIALTAVFFILSFFTKALSGILGLSAESFFGGHVYVLLTYPFLSHSIMEVILNSLMLWLMGSEFESNWGRRRYLSYLITVIVGGGLVYLLVTFLFFKNSPIFSFPLFGLSGLVSSLCISYAVIYPERLFSFMMIIPIKAKYFCLILVAISLSQAFSGPMGVGAWGQLGAIGAAYLFMVVVSHRNFRALSAKLDQMTQLQNKRKGRAKLTIVKDNNDDQPKYWH